MELRQLEYYVELCRVRNFTRASENLNVAQPSVTKAIRKLEEELGTILIDRYKLRRKSHTLACGMKATFSMQDYISTT